MAMSKKNYSRFAQSIRIVVDEYRRGPNGDVSKGALIATKRIAEYIALDCAQDNPNFDRTRFMDACGFK